ncbi:sigma-70 family RNA polymerase sigma factor [Neptuniibacter sp. CAU 1671]|uniref:RNA polymerase sigma factor n=1 Tax=Neptuniibacter sp. CAU 1671 TaxID=3032593 RepID=UPI0023D9AD20|nr:sigma-70 family RNA polymerase sigma factor [Neptuniibacter sp. CAU 1671]MDF2183094.1 sigma-70 family RNA polymerase sigma factor [Neptuniibacter sp. CAU 1671]
MDEIPLIEDAHTLEHDVALAMAGDADALEAVVRTVQQDIYRLALRFLWHPQDAEDASQEILIRVITHLSSFRGESGFRTWVYRIACNALLTLRKKRMEQQSLSFDQFAEDLANGLADSPLSVEDDGEQSLLLEEVKIGCTLAMLQCLDRKHRLAYILGEIMELDHIQSADALQITPATFRKQLSRARGSILSFMTAQCGLINPDNACRCSRRVSTAITLGRVDPTNLIFATSQQQAKRFPLVLGEIRALEEYRRAAALYQSHPEVKPPDAFSLWLQQLLAEMPDRSLNDLSV